MAEIIDITDRLRTRKIAESLSGTGKIFCHPEDVHHFDWLPPHKVQTSTVMEQGKPHAIDLAKMMDFVFPKNMVLEFEEK